jgi:hypothetical protein
MTLSVELTVEEQERLAIQATARGISLEALVHDVLQDAAALNARPEGPQGVPSLPAWRGTVIAPLSREDIYGDGG